MIYAINYANEKYRKAQKLNTKSAYINGAQRVIEYGPQDLSEDFILKNQKILSCPRGNGYWLWKPYFIDKTMEQIMEGDYLVYSDSGAAYINKIQLLINTMEFNRTDIMLFQIKSLEKYYTKRDVFVALQCDEEKYADSPQICATFLLLKKTPESVRFIKEWLYYAQYDSLITDDDNCLGKHNYKGFIDHRHDQSLLSLLAKRRGIIPFRDASQHGNDMLYEKSILDRSTYPQIFDSHRNGNITPYWIIYKYKLNIRYKNLICRVRMQLSKVKHKIFRKN